MTWGFLKVKTYKVQNGQRQDVKEGTVYDGEKLLGPVWEPLKVDAEKSIALKVECEGQTKSAGTVTLPSGTTRENPHEVPVDIS